MFHGFLILPLESVPIPSNINRYTPKKHSVEEMQRFFWRRADNFKKKKPLLILTEC